MHVGIPHFDLRVGGGNGDIFPTPEETKIGPLPVFYHMLIQLASQKIRA